MTCTSKYLDFISFCDWPTKVWTHHLFSDRFIPIRKSLHSVTVTLVMRSPLPVPPWPAAPEGGQTEPSISIYSLNPVHWGSCWRCSLRMDQDRPASNQREGIWVMINLYLLTSYMPTERDKFLQIVIQSCSFLTATETPKSRSTIVFTFPPKRKQLRTMNPLDWPEPSFF